MRLRFGPIGRLLRASLLAGLLLATFSSGVRAADTRSSIGGTVYLDKNRDGQPSGKPGLEGVEVRLDGQGRSDRARSGPKGGYGFDDLKAGSYDVAVIPPPGYEASTEPRLVVTVDGRNGARALNFGLSPLRPTATPTVTTTPTATAVPPTATPAPTATPSPAEATPTATGTAVGGGRGGPGLPSVASLSPLRYAPGRDRASQIGGWTNGETIALGVPFRSQLDGSDFAEVNCGPASLSMALAAFGIDLHPDTIRDYVNFLTQNADPDSGTSLDALARIAREAGLAPLDLYGRGSYRTWTVDLVRQHIRQGHPVVTLARYQSLPGNASSRAEADHYIVVTGLVGDDLIYNDAAFMGRAGYALMISAEDLERAWQFSSIPGNGMALTLEGEPTIPAWLKARRATSGPTVAELHGESGPADPLAEPDNPAPIEEMAEPAAQPTPPPARRKAQSSVRHTGARPAVPAPSSVAPAEMAEQTPAPSSPGPLTAALILLVAMGGSGVAGWRLRRLRLLFLTRLSCLAPRWRLHMGRFVSANRWRLPGRPRPEAGTALLLMDRLLPALAFSVGAAGRCLGLLMLLRRGPDPGLPVWPLYPLQLAHQALAFMFFGLIATLFLIRRSPQGNRAAPLPLAIALLGTFVMNAATSQPVQVIDWPLLALANLLAAAGLAFTVYSATSLGSCFGLAPEARGLVTTGAYRLVRHPLYLGEFVAMFGAFLPLFAPLTVFIFALFSLLQATRMVLEERVLAATFPEYAAYRLRTPAILPWPRPSRPLKFS